MKKEPFKFAFETVFKSIFEEFNSEFTSYKHELYHYTNLNGVIGITDSQKIWATNALYLNDSSEIQYGKDLLKERLSKIDTQERLLHYIISNWAEFQVPTIYLFSLSNKRDSLSQWRGYGDQGNSFAIKFWLTDLMGLLLTKASIKSVIYDRKVQDTIIDRIIEYILKIDKEIGNGNDIQSASFGIFSALIYLLPFLKNSSFYEEEEVRIVTHSNIASANNFETKYRIYNGNLIPFVELPILESNGKNSVREIIVGPNQNPELVRQSLQSKLNNIFDLKNIPVNTTSIPLRF
ncbi:MULTISPECIES: DUF2971 domain-containing protein [unclassified Leptospira]|uniref:DUF2971 domain-containing protein n=1 Tax=unclassified Leptospira TaxID=2633828 RepID=UPI0002BFD108|nr:MULTISPECIES: DUF2971 domain-containing protein [unclassified Leptospira]EMJ98296.1 PF11185 family protein [Leptospira sp. B5-022]MCR1795688.1 DUF2971 domain-containing protein [Leptospira sp. id769339]